MVQTDYSNEPRDGHGVAVPAVGGPPRAVGAPRQHRPVCIGRRLQHQADPFPLQIAQLYLYGNQHPIRAKKNWPPRKWEKTALCSDSPIMNLRLVEHKAEEITRAFENNTLDQSSLKRSLGKKS